MKRVVAALAAFFIFTIAAAAQNPPVTGIITAAGSSCSSANCVVLPLTANSGSVGVTLGGTFTATAQFEVSGDGQGSYSAALCAPVSGGSSASSATAGGLWVCPTAGMTHLRVRGSAYTSGTLAVNLQESKAPPLSATGTGSAATQVQGAFAKNTPSEPNPVIVGYDDIGGGGGVKAWPSANTSDGGATGNVPLSGLGELYNGSTADRARSESAANQTLSTSIGIQMVAVETSSGPVNSAPTAGAQATASIAPGGTGVRHVIDQVCFAAAATTAPTATQVNINIRNGATGAGTVLTAFAVAFPASTGTLLQPNCVPIHAVGSVNTAATAEFSAGVTSVFESVALYYHDIN